MAEADQAFRKILVVEDDALAREALCEIRQAGGYSVAAAPNGAEALDALRGGSLPDLVLLDLMMPVMDGWQFRREQRRDPALSGVPVVLCSALWDGDTHTQALAAAGFVNKPVEPEELLGLIGELLG